MASGPRAALFVFAAALTLGAPGLAVAGPLSAIAKLAKAGAKAGSTAGKAGKLAGGAKAAKLVGGAGAALAAERSAAVFAHIGDDAGRAATYLGKDASGEFRLIVKNGGADVTTHSPSAALAELPQPRADVYVDLSAASHPNALPPPSDDVRLFVLDAEARPHPLRAEPGEDGALKYVVDHAGDAVDLGLFVDEQLADGDDGLPGPFPFVFGGTALGALGIGGFFWLRRRKRARSQPNSPDSSLGG